MAGRAVDDGGVGHVFAVVDHDGPNLDEGKERDVGEFLQGEDEGEEVVGHALAVAVERVEGVTGERRRHDPFVVRLVQTLVEDRVVQGAVDPVDAEVCEEDEERELQPVVAAAEVFEERVGESRSGDVVIDEAVAADFGDEPGGGEDGHDGDGAEGLLDFEAHLVFEVFGMLEGGFVENEDIAEGCEGAVDEEAKKPVVLLLVRALVFYSLEATYHVMRYKLTNCLYILSLSHRLMNAYSLGCTLKYSLEGLYCHALTAYSIPLAASCCEYVSLSKPLKPAVRVLIGSKGNAVWMGRMLA